MKFQVEIDIDLPRHKVLEYYTNTQNLRYWFDGFRSLTCLSDAPCEVGAKYELKFSVGNMNIQVTETIKRNDLPEELWLVEESDGLTNLLKNFFVELDDDKTKWVIISNYEGEFLPQIGPSAFKKKTVKFMESFKDFVEQERVS